MTLPQFAVMIRHQCKPEYISNYFESYVAVYRILHKYFESDDIDIAVVSNKSSSKGIFKINVKPVREIDDLLRVYNDIQLELFNVKLQISSKIIKNNELVITTKKK